MLSQVVYDSIIFEGRKMKRKMPRGLDVMAALGNDEAVPLLAADLRKWNYAANLKASMDFVDAHAKEWWGSNLYNLWLDSLRRLDTDLSKETHAPQVMRTKTWQMKQLQTQLGSWAQLRHDTILYAKQSYTAGVSCEYPAGYVEPYPDFYAGIRRFAETAAELFGRADYTGIEPRHQERHVAFFRMLAQRTEMLERLARKELAAEPFTEEENVFLKKTIDARGGGSGPPRYDGWYCDLFYRGGSSARKWDPTIADVHTDPDSRSVLEVGVGNVNFLVAAIDNDGDYTVYVGPIFSYYEFKYPSRRRLTDQVWQKMIQSGDLPDRPEWTRAFQAPTVKRTLERGRRQNE